MPLRSGPTLRRLRHACVAALMGLVALPDPAFASPPLPGSRSLDAMSDAELERFVRELNETANWRKYRRPGDPPDFVPGQPVKVSFGAGAALGRGGGRAGGGAFRRSGLGARRSGLSSRRRGGREQASSGLGSSSRGSRGSASQSSFGGGSRSGGGGGGGNGNSNFGTSFNQGGFGQN